VCGKFRVRFGRTDAPERHATRCQG
jgi:hypothetical protein